MHIGITISLYVDKCTFELFQQLSQVTNHVSIKKNNLPLKNWILTKHGDRISNVNMAYMHQRLIFPTLMNILSLTFTYYIKFSHSLISLHQLVEKEFASTF